jgi:hypothetical protein
MTEHSSRTNVPSPSDPAPDSLAADELSDEDLEYVVGGLARVWMDDVPPTSILPAVGPIRSLPIGDIARITT